MIECVVRQFPFPVSEKGKRPDGGATRSLNHQNWWWNKRTCCCIPAAAYIQRNKYLKDLRKIKLYTSTVLYTNCMTEKLHVARYCTWGRLCSLDGWNAPSCLEEASVWCWRSGPGPPQGGAAGGRIYSWWMSAQPGTQQKRQENLMNMDDNAAAVDQHLDRPVIWGFSLWVFFWRNQNPSALHTNNCAFK